MVLLGSGSGVLEEPLCSQQPYQLSRCPGDAGTNRLEDGVGSKVSIFCLDRLAPRRDGAGSESPVWGSHN